jgi:hypothetical protein
MARGMASLRALANAVTTMHAIACKACAEAKAAILFVIARSDSDEAIQPPRKPPSIASLTLAMTMAARSALRRCSVKSLFQSTTCCRPIAAAWDPTYDAQGYTHIKLKK